MTTNLQREKKIPTPKYITQYKERIFPDNLEEILDPDNPPTFPAVEKWEKISKKLRLCPECWTLSEGAGYCICGGFKRLDFSDLTEKDQKLWIDGFERGESQALQQQREEIDREHIEAFAKYLYDLMPFDGEGKKPDWVIRGNSFKQDEARRNARKILSDLLTKEEK